MALSDDRDDSRLLMPAGMFFSGDCSGGCSRGERIVVKYSAL